MTPRSIKRATIHEDRQALRDFRKRTRIRRARYLADRSSIRETIARQMREQDASAAFLARTSVPHTHDRQCMCAACDAKVGAIYDMLIWSPVQQPARMTPDHYRYS